jgi:hypothetical protein
VKEPSYLQSQELKNAESGDLKILAGLKASDKIKRIPTYNRCDPKTEGLLRRVCEED